MVLSNCVWSQQLCMVNNWVWSAIVHGAVNCVWSVIKHGPQLCMVCKHCGANCNGTPSLEKILFTKICKSTFELFTKFDYSKTKIQFVVVERGRHLGRNIFIFFKRSYGFLSIWGAKNLNWTRIFLRTDQNYSLKHVTLHYFLVPLSDSVPGVAIPLCPHLPDASVWSAEVWMEKRFWLI